MNTKQRLTIYTILFLVLLLFISISFRLFKLKRPYKAKHNLTSKHFTIESNASLNLVQDSLLMAEKLHSTYLEYAKKIGIKLVKSKKKHSLRLYKDRNEFREFNITVGWAEAYYFDYRSHFYINKYATSPFHWMIHETTHQLNKELAGFQVNQWLEEGLASYFSTSFIKKESLQLGSIDENTYPIWWYTKLKFPETIEQALSKKVVIPLKSLISGNGGPSMNSAVNQYYIHWCSLVHFLNESESHKYQSKLGILIQNKGTLKSFEGLYGPSSEIQVKWYEHLKTLSYKLKQ